MKRIQYLGNIRGRPIFIIISISNINRILQLLHFRQHLRSMRIMGSMNNMMSSLFADPFQQMFQMGSNGFGGFPHLMYPQMQQNRPFGQIMPSMGGSQMNRLLGSGEGFPENAVSYSSSSVYSMNGGQIYQSTSSTKCLGSGVKETKQTVQDSRSGTKKMMVGRHLGERYAQSNIVIILLYILL